MEPPPPSSVPAPMEAVTPEEYAAGEITDAAKLHRIRDAFLRTGVAVVQNVVPHEVLDRMGARLDWDAAHQVASDAAGMSEAYRAASGHLACGLPRNAPHVFPEVVQNPIMHQIVVVCLGGAAFMRYYNGNTSLPGSEPQGLHMCDAIPSALCFAPPDAAALRAGTAAAGRARRWKRRPPRI